MKTGLTPVAAALAAKLGVKPVDQVRFIWFSGEEQGLLGSDFYVGQLAKSARSSIAAMLNFDMIGVAGPNGSGTIEKVFKSFFDARAEFTKPTAFDGRSDYDAFTTAGIPAGGLFTGAGDHETPDGSRSGAAR